MPGFIPDHTDLTAQTWPIAAAMLPFPSVTSSGGPIQEASDEVWAAALAEVAHEGFTEVDLTDSWVKPGDLDGHGIERLGAVLRGVGLRAEAISAIRRSVIDPETGDENLAYSHRTIDAAAALGCSVVSVGLHRPLWGEQQKALWFWTADGPHDSDDRQTWTMAVGRLRELGSHAASVGLVLSLEMYEDTLLGTADSAVRLINDIGQDAVGLNPDLGNLYRLHRPVEPFLEAMAKCAPYTNYWHVKNYYRLEDFASGTVMSVPAPMDSGTMNYRKAVKIALHAGFTGAFCVEHYGGDGLAVMARNRDYLRGLLSFDVGPASSPEVI